MRLIRPLFIVGLCLTPLFLSAQAPDVSSTTPTTAASPSARASEEMIDSIRLRSVALDLVLDRLEAWTGRTILRPEALPTATITLNITRPLPKSEAIRAIISVLNLNNIGVIELGDKFLKVVELANRTRTEAPEMIIGSTLDLPASGKVASKIFELTYLKAAEVVPQLNTTLNVQLGGAVFFTNTNAFLVTDSLSNLQRIEQLLLALDRPASANFKPKFYSLRYAKASDLVTKIKLMLTGPSQITFGNSTTLAPDDRTNQIVLIADPKQQAFYDELIAKLDVKADPNTRNDVIFLKHATAKDVATLLSSVITGQNAAQTKASGGATRPPQQPGGNPAQQPAPTSVGFNNSAGNSTTEFSNLLTVASDDRSNAIVVSGTVDDIRLIKELIDKIDVLLAQVRIEVVIAEVTLTDTDKSGITALNLTVGPNRPAVAAVTNSTTGAIITPAIPASGSSITNFSGAVAGWNVTNGVVNPLAFAAAMSDNGSKSNLKVLSAPTIVTTHNNEATIVVGESRPIITGSTSGSSGSTTGLTTSSSVTYKDIAIDLKVTPLIGEDGNIQLKIDQKVEDVIDNVTIDGNSQPVIGKRQATSFINVQDGEMIVLGGLQRSNINNNRSKLGFIWEIPGLSQLLGGRTNTKTRTELLLFIRPHVLPPSHGTSEAQKEINRLSNRDEIKAYLKATDPNAPVPPEKPTPPPAPSATKAPSTKRPR